MRVATTDPKGSQDIIKTSHISNRHGMLTIKRNLQAPRERLRTRISDRRVTVLGGNPGIMESSEGSEVAHVQARPKTCERC